MLLCDHQHCLELTKKEADRLGVADGGRLVVDIKNDEPYLIKNNKKGQVVRSKIGGTKRPYSLTLPPDVGMALREVLDVGYKSSAILHIKDGRLVEF